MGNNEQTVIEVSDMSLAKAFISVQAAANKKAEYIRVLDLKDLSSITDYFVICTAFSARQTQAIADAIAIELKEEGIAPISLEGYREGRWVVLDYGDIVVHVFQDALRDYYDLEDLWHEAKKVPVPQELYIPSTQH